MRLCANVFGVGLESDGEALMDSLGVRRFSLGVSAKAHVDPMWLDAHLQDRATLTSDLMISLTESNLISSHCTDCLVMYS